MCFLFHSFMLQHIELISYIMSLVILLSREWYYSYSGLSWNCILFCRFTHSLKRRLRIRTLQYSTARDINDLYDSVDSEVVLSILVHKVFCYHLLLKCLKQYMMVLVIVWCRNIRHRPMIFFSLYFGLFNFNFDNVDIEVI